jgi:hypothetical protein
MQRPQGEKQRVCLEFHKMRGKETWNLLFHHSATPIRTTPSNASSLHFCTDPKQKGSPGARSQVLAVLQLLAHSEMRAVKRQG